MSEEALSVLKGTLNFLALRALAGGGRMHGLEILDFIHATTAEAVHLEDGALYPALHRMQKRGWLDASWGVSTKGRRAKFYQLTEGGHAALAVEQRRWDRYVEAVARLAAAAPAPESS